MSDGTSRDDRPEALEATALASPSTLPGVGAAGAATVSSHRDELAPGAVIGHFVIERKVGAGGMGEVYAAHDPTLDRRVAIKVLRPSGRGADAATRLVREAQALAKLAHPNVVAVYEVGEAGERVFLAMQFVEGTTLGEHLARTRPRWPEIVRLYLAAGRGLAAAHAAGLIHRDVKPSNVLIDRAGHVAVTDFGVARAADDASIETSSPSWGGPSLSGSGKSALSTDVTQAGAVIGTPAYMAPEQHAGRRATAASDQFGFCVSLWQGLFGVHPYVPPGHGEVTSPFEYMALVGEGPLMAPPAGHKVPRAIVRALARGLAREPAARWPSMDDLLAVLEPRTPYRAAVIALAAVATLGAGAAVWFAIGANQDGDDRAPCRRQAGERVATAWSGPQRAAIATAFTATGRSFASGAAATTSASLDRYAERFTTLATDACAAGGTDAIATARRQCLDRALVELRTVVGVLTEAPRGEAVDNAAVVVAGLPALDDCADPERLAAVGAPPPAQAATVATLEARLATARAQSDAGTLREADSELAAIATAADAVPWPALSAQARIVRGEARLSRLEPAGAVLREAAAIATEHRLSREAARAWTALVQVAAGDRQPDALAAYQQIATAMARATGDRTLEQRVRIRVGRSLVRLRRLADAERDCRAVLDELRALPSADLRDVGSARDCVLEALVPAGRWPEVDALVKDAIADRRRLAGDGHPAIADYQRMVAMAATVRGDAATAKQLYTEAAELRAKAFGTEHIRYAESLGDLAEFEADPASQRAMLERALAIAEASDSPQRGLIARSLHASLADLAMQQGDLAGMRSHFERGIEIATQATGPGSLDVAVMLLGYGQYLASNSPDEGLAKLREAVALFEKLASPRVNIARGALAIALRRVGRAREALPVLEAAIATADPASTDPFNLALMQWSLARTLVDTDGDRVRARALATTARDQLRALGDRGAAQADDVEAWLRDRKHR